MQISLGVEIYLRYLTNAWVFAANQLGVSKKCWEKSKTL